jgi:hypothetical protein
VAENTPETVSRMHITVPLEYFHFVGLEEGQRVVHAYYQPANRAIRFEFEGEGPSARKTMPGAESPGCSTDREATTLKVVIDRAHLLQQEIDRLTSNQGMIETLQHVTDGISAGLMRGRR